MQVARFLLCLIQLKWVAISLSMAALPDGPWGPFALQGTPFHDIDYDQYILTPSPSSPPIPSPSSPPSSASASSIVRIAFIADVDLRPSGAGHALLKLVADEKVDATLVTGDNDYFQLGQERPERWGQRRTYPSQGLRELDRSLGANHPVFAVMGNHEAESDVVFRPQPQFPDEPTYAAMWKARMERVRLNDSCTGWIGGDSACSLLVNPPQTHHHPVLIVSSNVAVTDEPQRLAQRRIEHEEFVLHALNRYGPHARWRLCQWHVPAELLNTGNLPRSPQDDPGMKIYENCIKAGAIIVTGHDHTYARTKGLRAPLVKRNPNSQQEEIAIHGAPYYYPPTATRAELLVLSEGSSFAFVNGLGGQEIRSTYHGKHNAPHWAKLKYAEPRRGSSPRDSTALLCTFGALAPPSILKSVPRTRNEFIQSYGITSEVADRIDDLEAQSGWCVLKTAEGQVEDEFVLLSVVSVEKEEEKKKKNSPRQLPPATLSIPSNPALLSKPVPEPSTDIELVEPIIAKGIPIQTQTNTQVRESVDGFLSVFVTEPMSVPLLVSLVCAVGVLVLRFCFFNCSRSKLHAPDTHVL